MKKQLILILLLLTGLVSFAQSGWQKVKRTKADGSIQRGWVRRNTTLYPIPSGDAAFEAAVNNGSLFVQTTDPFSTYTPPTSVTGSTGPGWASADYSYTNGVLIIRVSADVAAIRTDRNDGVLMNGSSPDLGAVGSGVFLTPTNTAPSGDFSKVLRISWTPPPVNQSLKLTFRRTNGELYSQNVTIQSGASNVVLFAPAVAPSGLSFQIVSYNCQTGVLQYKFVSPVSGGIAVSMPGIFAGTMSPGVVASHTFPSDGKVDRAVTVAAVQGSQSVNTSFVTACNLTTPGSGTVTNPPSSTATVVYNRVLVFGNSITWNSWNGNTHGMAASSPNKDFFSILRGYFQAGNPSVDYRKIGDFNLPYGNVEGSHWEQYYWDLYNPAWNIAPFGLDHFQAVTDWVPDLIVMEIGDNITDNSRDLATHYVALVNKFKAKNPNCRVIVCTPIITYGTTNTILTNVAAAQGWALAELSGISGATAILNHPDDGAMQIIADRIWAKVPAPSTTPVTPPSTEPSNPLPTSGAMLSYNDDPSIWNDDLTELTTSQMKVQFRKSIGAGVWYMGPLNGPDDMSMIQVNRHGETGPWDTGRGFGWAGYGSPFANEYFCVDGACTGTNPPPNRGGIGNNPCMGGSVNPNDGSVLLKAAKVQTAERGTVLCVQVRPKQWDLLNKPSHYVLNMEYWYAAPNALAYKLQVITEVRPANVTPASKWSQWDQEEITMYVPSKYRQRIVRQNGQDKNLWDTELSNQNSTISETGIGTYTDDLSYGLTIWTPDCVAMKSGHGVDNWADDNRVGGPRAPMWGFMQSRPKRNLDCPGSYTYQAYAIIGSRADALARIASLPKINDSFDFDFTDPNNWQHGWSSSEAWKVENGQLVHDMGAVKIDEVSGGRGQYGGLFSPIRRWAASSIPAVAIKMAVSGGGSGQLQFFWTKLGANGQTQEYSKTFAYTGDSIERTYSVNLAGTPGWDGYINQVAIKSIPGMPENTRVILKSVKKQ